MPNASDIAWFKSTFQADIQTGLAGTPFHPDLITAIACQETGYIWQVLRKKNLPVKRILELCVGDTLDSSGGRGAFPQTKSDLVAAPGGQGMFDIARQALVDMAQYIPGYAASAAKPNKFCHGFGILQYDLQFFKTDPGFFLDKHYAVFGECLKKAVAELKSGLRKLGWQAKTSLTPYEMACLAITYNTGRFKPNKGLKQGYFNGTQYYGEAFYDFLQLVRTVPAPDAPAPLPTPDPGEAIVEPPPPLSAAGATYRVETSSTVLRLRSAPSIDPAKPTANVITQLPDGHLVKAVGSKAVNGFLEVETSLGGATWRGFASTTYLKKVADVPAVPVVVPAPQPPTTGVVAVYMPRKAGSVTKRTDLAGPHSLNEAGQPGRKGATAQALRESLGGIIDWLAVDKPAHVRYQPRDGLTFCNIYAHDYCHLSGVYLPRVWWTPGAIEQLAQGKVVEPKYGASIEEVRANGLFRWLRDFGPRFGWRQVTSLSELQQAANQGAVGVIVARRKEDGKSGHITVIAPETTTRGARRNGAGEVTGAVESQAGASNFRYGFGAANWWRGEKFAESGFWVHA